ncbi:MAG TPA: cardiolipin synthase [Clostridia bacterium]|nr:cardiolipin synthase [Clostridia bacterium]
MNPFQVVTVTYTIISIIIGIDILLDNRDPSSTVAWFMVLFILPIVGIFLYLYIGRNHRKKKTFIKKRSEDYVILNKLLKEQFPFINYEGIFKRGFSDIRGKIIPLLLNNTGSPVTVNNKVKILQNGEATFAEILDAIKNAKEHIHAEYFIIKDSNIGREFQQALIKKAEEGLEVRLIYDAVGSIRLRNSFIKPLKNAGVQIGCFLPVALPFFGARLNYRNHRKILVVDGKIGFTGGINIGDEYLGKDKKMGFWRDTHLKIQGEAAYVLQGIFLADWNFVSNETIDGFKYFPPQGYCGEKIIQIASSGPDSHWASIHQAYFSAFSSARERIYITTPYLVPDDGILLALKTAALRGVDVRLLLPIKPDHKTVFWASKSHFKELLESGVRIYQYAKGFIHGKVFIVDNNFVSIGTANLDIRSFKLNFEVNAFIYDKETNHSVVQNFLEDLQVSREVTLDEYINRPIIQKIKESTARVFSPIL